MLGSTCVLKNTPPILSWLPKNMQATRMINRDPSTRKYRARASAALPKYRHWRIVSNGLTLKRMYRTTTGEIKTESKGISADVVFETMTPLGRKKPDEKLLDQACTHMGNACLPLILLASLPERGWMKLPVENFLQMTLQVKYRFSSHEDRWELMNAFSKSEFLEDITDSYELGLLLRERMEGRKRNLTAYVDSLLRKRREEGQIFLERFAMHPRKYREITTGRSPLSHRCTQCGDICNGSPFY